MKHRGFTLIELLVVVIIIGVLTSIAVPQYRKALDRARTAEVMQMLPALYEARERWILENGYHWSGNRIVNAAGKPVDPTLDQLDIELKVKPTSPTNKTYFFTNNFTYSLLGYYWNLGGGAGSQMVYATPNFNVKNRNNLPGMLISYNGGEVCCSIVINIVNEESCERLNIPACPPLHDGGGN